jgi:hypothetical protein
MGSLMEETVIGLYGNGMHDFILRECEIGFRAAALEDAERCDPMDWLHELQYGEYLDELVAAAPPFTTEQEDLLVRVFGNGEGQ